MSGKCESKEKAWHEAKTIREGIAGMIFTALLGAFFGGAPGFGGGLVAGFLGGMCMSRATNRLKKHEYEPNVCVTGQVYEAWKNDGLFVPPLALWGKVGWGAMKFFERDGDWLFNILVLDNQKYLLTEAYDGGQAFVRYLSDCRAYLHCEISSNEGPFGCFGSTIGALAGMGFSMSFLAPLAASCAAWGIFFWVCLLLVALLALVITYLASAVGGLIGAALGKMADAIEGQGQKGKSVKAGDCVTLCGAWVTDMDHGWNEIHDIETVQIHGKGSGKSSLYCLRVAGSKAVPKVK